MSSKSVCVVTFLGLCLLFFFCTVMYGGTVINVAGELELRCLVGGRKFAR